MTAFAQTLARLIGGFTRRRRTAPPDSRPAARAALPFVVLIGITSLFADFTYKAARSVNGQFLATLGASAAVAGFAAGFVNWPGTGRGWCSGGWRTERGVCSAGLA